MFLLVGYTQCPKPSESDFADNQEEGPFSGSEEEVTSEQSGFESQAA